LYTQGLLTIANKIFSTLALAATAFRLTPADLARAAQPAGPGGPHLPVWRDTSSGGPHLGRLEGPMQEGPSRRTTSRRDSSSGYRRFLRETPTSRRASSSGPPLPLGNFSSHTLMCFAYLRFPRSMFTRTVSLGAYAIRMRPHLYSVFARPHPHPSHI
jgi:hypothetical protein